MKKAASLFDDQLKPPLPRHIDTDPLTRNESYRVRVSHLRGLSIRKPEETTKKAPFEQLVRPIADRRDR